MQISKALVVTECDRPNLGASKYDWIIHVYIATFQMKDKDFWHGIGIF